ncbi:RING-HC_RNF170 domain-containing protein [Cebidichthys violaceus]|uniref:RING-HC_RNF170 domain-containing protein n=1 Tax=Cebidichthys violaceus TaxID=271503 RepID=UPI0035CB2FB3
MSQPILYVMLVRQRFTSFQETADGRASGSAMRPHHSSQSRPDRLPSEAPAGQGHLGSPGSPASTPPSRREEATQSGSSVNRDGCPVCLQTARFPVRTNCGHLFCAPCLIAYWRHGSWLDAISCPLCRQKVSVLCHLFNETRSDRQSEEVLGEITDYNKRYSGAPRRVTEYLCDAPLLLQLAARSLGAIGGLVWLFFFRVALCCVGTVVSISSTPQDAAASSANPLETDPSLHGLLGVLDDLVVVILLLICVININQQMAPETGGRSVRAEASGGVMGRSL